MPQPQSIPDLSRSLPQAASYGAVCLPVDGVPAPAAPLTWARARVHELCGPARVALALMLAGATEGPVLWVQPGWLADRPCADGISAFLDPGRLILLRCRRPEDSLWSMEEGLRSGAVGVAMAELTAPPPLTPVRRLHLAAAAGAEAARHHGRPAPLGVILTPDDGGAAGVESRWSMAPRPSRWLMTDARLEWRLARLRARGAMPAAWDLSRDRAGRYGLAPPDQAAG